MFRRKTSDLFLTIYRSSRPEMFLRKGILKICSKSAGKHPCRSANSLVEL